MTSTQYLTVYALLLGATVAELAVIRFALAPLVIVLSVIVLAGLKASLIALFYQHLKDEPKPVSGIVLTGLITVVIFMVLSLLSIRVFIG